MLITFAREDGCDRLYLAQFSSVRCYLTESPDHGGGCMLHLEPGFTAYPPEFERNAPLVEEAILNALADRVGVTADEVLSQPFDRLRTFADPALPAHYRYARRTRSRTAPVR